MLVLRRILFPFGLIVALVVGIALPVPQIVINILQPSLLFLSLSGGLLSLLLFGASKKIENMDLAEWTITLALLISDLLCLVNLAQFRTLFTTNVDESWVRLIYAFLPPPMEASYLIAFAFVCFLLVFYGILSAAKVVGTVATEYRSAHFKFIYWVPAIFFTMTVLATIADSFYLVFWGQRTFEYAIRIGVLNFCGISILTTATLAMFFLPGELFYLKLSRGPLREVLQVPDLASYTLDRILWAIFLGFLIYQFSFSIEEISPRFFWILCGFGGTSLLLSYLFIAGMRKGKSWAYVGTMILALFTATMFASFASVFLAVLVIWLSVLEMKNNPGSQAIEKSSLA